MAIIRGSRPSDRFVQMANAAAQDERLSYRARGVLVSLLSRPPGWKTTSQQIAAQGTEGRDAIRSALQELERLGYLERRKTRNEAGRWQHDQYVTDEPVHAPEPDNPSLGLTSGNTPSPQVSPVTDNPSSGNQAVSTKTDVSKTDRKTEVRGEGSVVVSPSVTRASGNTTTTPSRMLDGVGLARRDHGRFKEWMRTVKGARSADAVIAKTDHDDLTAQVREWRTTLDITNEPDAEPVLCGHGHDVSLGAHMCPVCDPDRPHLTDTPGTSPERPQWLQDILAAGELPGLADLLDSREVTA